MTTEIVHSIVSIVALLGGIWVGDLPTTIRVETPRVETPYERFLTTISNFEPLTDENLDIVDRMLTYHDYKITLPNGDVLDLIASEIKSIHLGYYHYRTTSFLNKCLTKELEHPQIREHIDIRKRHHGWGKVEFIRDASARFRTGNSLGDSGVRRISSLYIVDGKQVFHTSGMVVMSTCELQNFRLTEVVKNDKGYYVKPDCLDCFMYAQPTVFHTLGILKPLTNQEIETGYILTR